MPKKRRFDFTKKNKRSGKVENVGYLDLEQDEEQSRCSLYFYGDIVSATWESMWYEEDRCPQDIADFLNQLDGYEDIDIYFNSGGGDVFAGLAIYNQLKRYDGHKVGYVDGMAASIASVIMFACDELHFATGAQRYFINSITVEQYKKYISLMEKNSTEKISGVMFFNTKIVQELFGNELTLAEIGEIDVIDFLTAIKTVHFVMQNIIAEKLLNIVEVEQVEKEKSAFDEYDRENGYEDEPEEPEENQWKVCGEIVDRVVKIAIRLLKNSYSQCMKENIVTLLEYLRFELDTINENQ